MGYASLAQCVADLRRQGQLRIVDTLLDPCLEIGYVQRRVFQTGGPALLFTRPKGCRFPMLANLFGTKERVNYIFRDSLPRLKEIFTIRANPALARPLRALKLAPALWHSRPKWQKNAPVLARACALSDLPALKSWPQDGGPFITLPLVYSAEPGRTQKGNLGMYRVQLAGNDYAENEVGLHYQLKRGIGIHHAMSLGAGRPLPVNVHVGGPPALSLAAVMPLPEGMSELLFAGLLGGRRVRLGQGKDLPVLADADFVIQGYLDDTVKPEGPFGDHLGYYSLTHPFPVLKVHSVHHREDAIWPFTTVGRPPQEDTVFGDLIHELTAPLVSQVFPGLKEIHAVDAAGVHPLLLAIGEERYAPYQNESGPAELLTHAMHLLGATQTSLAKFVLIAENSPGCPSCRNVADFLRHMLERIDFQRDLRFITPASSDTLDYSGYKLHQGSRLIMTACGPKRRNLASEIRDLPELPSGFSSPRVCLPGIMAIREQRHSGKPDERDPEIEKKLCACLTGWRQAENFPLVVIVDDPDFCSASLANFLWVAFTRSDPCRDSYGVNEKTVCKRWSCDAPLVLDGRLKAFQPAPLEDDPALVEYIETLASGHGPLAGLF